MIHFDNNFDFFIDITPEDFAFISSGLEACSKETLTAFSKEFLNDSLKDWTRAPNWLNVMSMLTNWMMNENSQGHLVTKAELARKIYLWGNDNKDEKFQTVARRLLNKGIWLLLFIIHSYHIK